MTPNKSLGYLIAVTLLKELLFESFYGRNLRTRLVTEANLSVTAM
jgi:hypothetical protein